MNHIACKFTQVTRVVTKALRRGRLKKWAKQLPRLRPRTSRGQLK